MANPTLNQLHIDRPLSDIAFANFNQDSAFVAGIVAPALPVAKRSDKYFIYDSGDILRDDAKLRAPGTESEGNGFNLSTSSYLCEVYARHQDITDQDLANSDLPNLRMDAARIVTQKLKIKRERIFVDTFFKQGVWTYEASPGTKWDAASSTPIKDIKTQIDNIVSRTGCDPMGMTLTVSPNTMTALMENADVLDRIRYTMKAIASPDLLASVLGIRNVVVARAIYNSAAEGVAATPGYIATSESALLTYSAPAPGMYNQSAMYNFVWTGLDNVGMAGPGIIEIPVPTRKAIRIEGQIAFDMKITSQDSGYFFYNVLT